MTDDAIKSMKLYEGVGRIYNDLAHVGIGADDALTVDDLTPFDQFHYFGTDAVDAAIAALGIDGASRVLDVGAGLGGPARYMAQRTGCHVTALELQADIDGIGSSGMGLIAPVEIAEYLGLQPTWADGTGVGGATWEFMLEHATAAIQAGHAETVLLVYGSTTRSDLKAGRRLANLSFGGRGHCCLGAHLGRLETQIAIGGLIQRFDSVELVNEKTEWGRSLFRVPGRIPVTFKESPA